MKILLFGISKDIIGGSTLELGNEKNIQSVAQLRQFLMNEYPKFQEINSLAIAVNEVYAEDEVPISPTDTVALIPPVSGG